VIIPSPLAFDFIVKVIKQGERMKDEGRKEGRRRGRERGREEKNEVEQNSISRKVVGSSSVINPVYSTSM
jgi:hypothetical protein